MGAAILTLPLTVHEVFDNFETVIAMTWLLISTITVLVAISLAVLEFARETDRSSAANDVVLVGAVIVFIVLRNTVLATNAVIAF